MESGAITSGETLTTWLRDVLAHGAGRADAILLRHAHRAHGKPEALAGIAELALAASPTRERRAESTGQGNAFLRAAAPWNPEVLTILAARVGDIAYPVAVGAMAGSHGIPEDIACAGAMQAFAANLISSAVRLVPLGQSAGLASLAALEDTIRETTEAARTLTLDDLGGFAFRSDLAAMHHETQYTRLFRS